MSTITATQLATTTTRGPVPADRLQVSTTAPSEAVTLCAVAGEVDYYTADLLRTSLIGALSVAAANIVIDLSRVSFFGIAGLHVLIEARAWAEHTDRRLRLVASPRCVDRLLEASGDLTAFDRVPDLAAAVLDVA